MQSCAVDVEQLFDTHGHPDVIIGHSLGGKVAMELARGYTVQQDRLDVCILDSMPGAPSRVPLLAARQPLTFVVCVSLQAPGMWRKTLTGTL